MRIDMTFPEAAAIVATACGNFDSEEVAEVVFIVQRRCRNCRLPHIITAFGTPTSNDTAISLIAQALSRIADEGTFNER